MGLDQHVGCEDTIAEIGALAGMARILVRADIEPRPAIETAFPDAGRIIGRQIVSEAVALIGGAPERAALRRDGEPRAIADPVRERTKAAALGVGDQHACAIRLVRPGGADPGPLLQRRDPARRRADHPVSNVRGRTDGDEEPLAVLRESDIPRPVPARRQAWHDHLGGAARDVIASRIDKAHDAIRLGDIDVAGLRARRIEGHAIGPVQPARKGDRRRPLALRRRRQNADPARPAFRDEEITIRGGADHARADQPFRDERHVEPARHTRPAAVGALHDLGRDRHGSRGARLRHVLGPEKGVLAGPVSPPVAIGCRPDQRLRRRRKGEREKDQWGQSERHGQSVFVFASADR